MPTTRARAAENAELEQASRQQKRLLTNAINRYLEALDSATPRRRGRQVDPHKKFGEISRKLTDLDVVLTPVARLQLVQERMDMFKLIERAEASADIEPLQKEFIAGAKEWSEDRGISYAAWREVGVPAAVLKEAGIAR